LADVRMPDRGDGDGRRGTVAYTLVTKVIRRGCRLQRLPALIGKSRLAYYRGVDEAAEPGRDVAREDEVFRALADPTRRKILDELAERDGQTLFEICSRLTMKYQLGSSRQAISQHLEVLSEAGLVTSHREGRYKFHYINTEPLERLTDRWRNRETKEN
jgi:DNA-binding transcriptional ArsR family regulator